MKSGLAPIVLSEPELAQLRQALEVRNELTVDLEALEISHPDGLRIAFAFDAFARHMLLNGLDEVGLTLQRENRIAAFEQAHAARIDTTSLA